LVATIKKISKGKVLLNAILNVGYFI